MSIINVPHIQSLLVKRVYLGTNKEYSNGVYGIKWDRTHAAPEVNRIGNMSLHRTLPIQSLIKRCMLNDDGTVNYYLDENDSTKKANGTQAVLDGSDGQVMVEVPEHYIKYVTEDNNLKVMFSLIPQLGYMKIERYYVGAFKAALNRSNSKLSSVVNATAEYRGGNNNGTLDALPATQLGKPATAISRPGFDTYANNRGAGWKQITYNQRKNLYWLITCEFATRQHQAAVNTTLTPDGYKQGGLGTGATNISADEWTAFNSQYPALNCGITNSLGNQTGEKSITLTDFPTIGQTRTTQVNSYRGIENFFGDIWENTQGINYKIEGGVAYGYVSDDGTISDTDYVGYRSVGRLVDSSGYMKDIVFGEHGDILVGNSAGGSATTYYSDYFYLSSSDGMRAFRAGGTLAIGAIAGSACSHSNSAPSTTYTNIGSRLCFS